MNASPSSDGQKKGRDDKGRFVKGSVPNPNGKPKGTRNKVIAAIEAMLDDGSMAMFQLIYKQAMNGCLTSQRLLADRILPVRKHPDDARADQKFGEDVARLVRFIYGSKSSRGLPNGH